MTETLSSTNPTKKKRIRKPLPTLNVSAGADQMADVTYTAKVDTTPISWESLPLYAIFSANSDGSYPLVKINKTQYAEMRTGRGFPCGGGRCYRVFL